MIRPSVDMMEALRLTRQGRLEEAMAVLRGAVPASEASVKREAVDGATPVLDMVPPSMATGSAWTAPPAGAASDATQRGDIGPPPPSMPGGFLDRLRKLDITGGREGVAGCRMKSATVVIPAGARFETHDFANEAGSRRYKLYVPSRYTGEPLPLVVMLHGCTQSPDDFAAGTKMNERAEEQGLFVAYPAQPKSANPAPGPRFSAPAERKPWPPSWRRRCSRARISAPGRARENKFGRVVEIGPPKAKAPAAKRVRAPAAKKNVASKKKRSHDLLIPVLWRRGRAPGNCGAGGPLSSHLATVD